MNIFSVICSQKLIFSNHRDAYDSSDCVVQLIDALCRWTVRFEVSFVHGQMRVCAFNDGIINARTIMRNCEITVFSSFSFSFSLSLLLYLFIYTIFAGCGSINLMKYEVFDFGSELRFAIHCGTFFWFSLQKSSTSRTFHSTVSKSPLKLQIFHFDFVCYDLSNSLLSIRF